MPDTTSLAASRATNPTHARLLVVLAVASCVMVYASAFLGRSLSGVASIVGGVIWFPTYFLLRRCVQEAADLPGERIVGSWNGPWAAVLLLSAALPSAVLAWSQASHRADD